MAESWYQLILVPIHKQLMYPSIYRLYTSWVVHLGPRWKSGCLSFQACICANRVPRIIPQCNWISTLSPSCQTCSILRQALTLLAALAKADLKERNAIIQLWPWSLLPTWYFYNILYTFTRTFPFFGVIRNHPSPSLSAYSSWTSQVGLQNHPCAPWSLSRVIAVSTKWRGIVKLKNIYIYIIICTSYESYESYTWLQWLYTCNISVFFQTHGCSGISARTGWFWSDPSGASRHWLEVCWPQIVTPTISTSVPQLLYFQQNLRVDQLPEVLSCYKRWFYATSLSNKDSDCSGRTLNCFIKEIENRDRSSN